MDPAVTAIAGSALAALLDEFLKLKPHIHGEWTGDLLYDRHGDLYTVRQSAANPLRLAIPSIGFEYAYKGGFESDGGSIPIVFRAIKKLRLRPDDFLKSYFLHDYAYATASLWTRELGTSSPWARLHIDRAMADCLLYVGLTAEDATLVEARAIYRAVRIGGSIAWRQHRAKDA